MMNHTCPLCGHQYNEGAASHCAACPLNGGCTMLCCPNCGYQQPDPQESRLGRWASGWLKRRKARQVGCEEVGACTLAECRPGEPACVRGFHPDLSQARQRALHAHGLGPGRLVQVLHQRPVTIVQIGAAELALEGDLAALIEVERGTADES